MHSKVSALIILSTGLLLSCVGAASQGERTESVQEESSMESAKRRVIRVNPVSKNGVRYEEIRGAKGRGFEQNGGVIAAVDEATDKELWTLVVYKTEYDPQEEADVQDVFISKLKVNWRGTKLKVVNERKRSFEVDLETKAVTEL